MLAKIFNRQVRKYVYLLSVAFVPVAVYFGWIEPEASAIVLPFILALLNLSPSDVEQPVEE